MTRGFLAFVVLATGLGCSADVVREGDPITLTTTSPEPVVVSRSPWRRGVRRVVIEVDYARDAVPYTGNISGVGDAWGIFRTNAERLFRGAGVTVVVPTTLAQMQRIEVNTRDFTANELLALSRRWRDEEDTADTVTFHVMVLNGWLRDGSDRLRTEVLGGHLDDTNIIAIFKPVVASTGLGAAAIVPRVVEQSVLVHEFGHAVGLVDDGLADTRRHHDSVHPHHCTSSRCVMNAYNEGAGSVTAFVMRYAMTRSAVLFDDDCLADAAAAVAAARR